MTIAKNILTLTLLLLLFGVFELYSQKQIRKDKEEDEVLCNDCEVIIESDERYVDLGKIWVGTTNSDLPAEGGTGKSITFTVTGDANERYFVRGYLSLRSSHGSVPIVIDHWSWEAKSGCYEETFVDENLKINCLKLHREQGEGRCEADAKFRVNVDQISAPPEADAGHHSFKVFIVIIEQI